MASFARIVAGVVVELFDALPVLTPELMATVHPCSPQVQAGWTWDGTSLAAPPGPTLAEAKAARKAEVSGLYQQKLAAGTTYSGKPVQIDSASQLLIVGAAAQAIALGAQFPGVNWRMGDNTFLAMPDAAAMIQFAATIGVYVEGLRVRMWAHKDAIEALSDVAAVAAYDITIGW